MQQHPIPQNVTGFEFKLVGFLTLKQFLYLAAAGIISFIVFVSVSSILKWLVIVPVSLLALAFAFMPINGMKFDKWIVVFIRAITSPSRRVWYKEEKVLSFLEPQFSYYLRRPVAKAVAASGDRSKLDAYLAQIKSEKKFNKLDNLENTRLASLAFGTAKPRVIPDAGGTAFVSDVAQDRVLEPEYTSLAGFKEGG